MEKVYRAVPREDGGWKIIVQIIGPAEGNDEELPQVHRAGGAGSPPDPPPFRPGAVPPPPPEV